jgi:hypothetical protein
MFGSPQSKVDFMQRFFLAALVNASVMASGMASAAVAQQAFNFEADTVGKPPAGWTIAMTGKGKPIWTVEADASAAGGKVLRQSGNATYPLAMKTGSSIKDGFVEVKFKALAGKTDRAAGLIWRAADANNYYVVRANALEDNVVLYKTVNGKRVELDIVGRAGGYGLKAPVPPNQWHTLRVEFVGTRFDVIYNGRRIFEVDDATFKEAGMVGLWTKADSVTVFDGFTADEKK